MRQAAWSERRVAALFELAAAGLLLALLAVAFLRALRLLESADPPSARLAWIPAALAAGSLFAAIRARRALRKLRSEPAE